LLTEVHPLFGPTRVG